jgi:ubiquinone/menaquinone biosynthesis C-methylase UbiE
MATDYSVIAERYRRAKQQPWRSSVEAFTLLDLVGDPAGRSVIDLACGEGHYTRLLKQRGAAKVVGIDLSEGMIELARDEEEAHPLGIEYLVADGRDLRPTEPFDLAVAAYLLNCARDRVELASMCRGVARCLKPGGRFVTVNSNSDLDLARVPVLRKYGFHVAVVGELREGTPITWTFDLEDGPLRLEDYYLDVASHEEALRSAGFREVRWHKPRLSPLAEATDGRDYWEPFLSHAPVIFIECWK